MGGLCSRESPSAAAPQVNHASAGALAESSVPLAEVTALKAQLQQLQDRNASLVRELSSAQVAAREYAELQRKHAALQSEHDGLQRDAQSSKPQLTGAAGLQAALDAKAEAERKLAEVQKQFSELKSQNNQLRRRVSDLATGHAEPVEQAHSEPSTAAEDRCRVGLARIRDCNPSSKISIAFWRNSDYKRWHGVRTEHGEVTGLALCSMQVTHLPPEVGQLTGLTALLLSNNGLTQLPPTLGLLTCLTSLLLDGNHLKQLPAELCDLAQLQTLWLHDNQLTSLPQAVGRLTHLRQLIANDNALEELPASVGELKGLTSLWLDNNKLTALPDTFSRLTELKRLRLDAPLLKLVQEQFPGLGVASSQPALLSPQGSTPELASLGGQREHDQAGPSGVQQEPALVVEPGPDAHARVEGQSQPPPQDAAEQEAGTREAAQLAGAALATDPDKGAAQEQSSAVGG